VVDQTGLDSCSLLDWDTWGGCANNAVQTFNNVVVQPAANFVNNHVVKPIMNDVVVPLVKNVVIPLVVDYIAANNYVGQGLYQAGNYLYNGYLSFQRADNNFRQSLYHSINQDWQGFAHDITHLHVTDVNKLFTGLVECAGLALIAAVAWEALPEAAIAAGTIDLATYGTAAIGLGGIGYLSFGHELYEAGSFMVDLGAGCVGNTVGAFSTS